MYFHDILLLISITLVTGNYNYISERDENEDEEKLLNKMENMQLTSLEPFLQDDMAENAESCYNKCYELGKRCQSINIIDKDGQVKCLFYASATGSFKKSEGYLFVSRKAPTCSGYCENLQYLDLCTQCSCVNNCGMKTPYHCDCTNVSTPAGSCAACLAAGFRRSGVYKIKPDNGIPISVFCEMKGDTFGEVSAWATVMKRLHISEDFLAKEFTTFESGYGNVQHDDFWLGLKNLARILKSSQNNVLRVEMYDADLNEMAGEFDGFNLDENNYRISFESFKNTKGKLDDFFHLQTGLDFTKCNDNKYWWRPCDSTKPDSSSNVTNANRIRLLLRSKGLGEISEFPADSCGQLQEKKYPNGYYWIKGGADKVFCDMKYSEGPGKSQRSAIKSCKWAMDVYKDLKSGFYWTVLSEYTNVFCDMGVIGGGWTMIGHVRHTSASIDGFDFKTTMQNDITALERVVTESFLLATPGLKKLDQYISFSQMRLFCIKTNPGRVFHISTTDDDKGKAVVEFFKGENDDRPTACGSYTKMDDDDSHMARNCAMAGGGQNKWSRSGKVRLENRLRNVPFYIYGKDFALRKKGFKCDDTANNVNQGEWKFFVR